MYIEREREREREAWSTVVMREPWNGVRKFRTSQPKRANLGEDCAVI